MKIRLKIIMVNESFFRLKILLKNSFSVLRREGRNVNKLREIKYHERRSAAMIVNPRIL